MEGGSGCSFKGLFYNKGLELKVSRGSNMTQQSGVNPPKIGSFWIRKFHRTKRESLQLFKSFRPKGSSHVPRIRVVRRVPQGRR